MQRMAKYPSKAMGKAYVVSSSAFSQPKFISGLGNLESDSSESEYNYNTTTITNRCPSIRDYVNRHLNKVRPQSPPLLVTDDDDESTEKISTDTTNNGHKVVKDPIVKASQGPTYSFGSELWYVESDGNQFGYNYNTRHSTKRSPSRSLRDFVKRHSNKVGPQSPPLSVTDDDDESTEKISTDTTNNGHKDGKDPIVKASQASGPTYSFGSELGYVESDGNQFGYNYNTRHITKRSPSCGLRDFVKRHSNKVGPQSPPLSVPNDDVKSTKKISTDNKHKDNYIPDTINNGNKDVTVTIVNATPKCKLSAKRDDKNTVIELKIELNKSKDVQLQFVESEAKKKRSDSESSSDEVMLFVKMPKDGKKASRKERVPEVIKQDYDKLAESNSSKDTAHKQVNMDIFAAVEGSSIPVQQKKRKMRQQNKKRVKHSDERMDSRSLACRLRRRLRQNKVCPESSITASNIVLRKPKCKGNFKIKKMGTEKKLAKKEARKSESDTSVTSETSKEKKHAEKVYLKKDVFKGPKSSEKNIKLPEIEMTKKCVDKNRGKINESVTKSGTNTSRICRDNVRAGKTLRTGNEKRIQKNEPQKCSIKDKTKGRKDTNTNMNEDISDTAKAPSKDHSALSKVTEKVTEYDTKIFEINNESELKYTEANSMAESNISSNDTSFLENNANNIAIVEKPEGFFTDLKGEKLEIGSSELWVIRPMHTKMSEKDENVKHEMMNVPKTETHFDKHDKAESSVVVEKVSDNEEDTEEPSSALSSDAQEISCDEKKINDITKASEKEFEELSRALSPDAQEKPSDNVMHSKESKDIETDKSKSDQTIVQKSDDEMQMSDNESNYDNMDSSDSEFWMIKPVAISERTSSDDGDDDDETKVDDNSSKVTANKEYWTSSEEGSGYSNYYSDKNESSDGQTDIDLSCDKMATRKFKEMNSNLKSHYGDFGHSDDTSNVDSSIEKLTAQKEYETSSEDNADFYQKSVMYNNYDSKESESSSDLGYINFLCDKMARRQSRESLRGIAGDLGKDYGIETDSCNFGEVFFFNESNDDFKLDDKAMKYMSSSKENDKESDKKKSKNIKDNKNPGAWKKFKSAAVNLFSKKSKKNKEKKSKKPIKAENHQNIDHTIKNLSDYKDFIIDKPMKKGHHYVPLTDYDNMSIQSLSETNDKNKSEESDKLYRTYSSPNIYLDEANSFCTVNHWTFAKSLVWRSIKKKFSKKKKEPVKPKVLKYNRTVARSVRKPDTHKSLSVEELQRVANLLAERTRVRKNKKLLLKLKSQ